MGTWDQYFEEVPEDYILRGNKLVFLVYRLLSQLKT